MGGRGASGNDRLAGGSGKAVGNQVAATLGPQGKQRSMADAVEANPNWYAASIDPDRKR